MIGRFLESCEGGRDSGGPGAKEQARARWRGRGRPLSPGIQPRGNPLCSSRDLGV